METIRSQTTGTHFQESQQQWGQSSACGMIAAYTPPRVPAPGGNSRYFGPPYRTGEKGEVHDGQSLRPLCNTTGHMILTLEDNAISTPVADLNQHMQ